MEHENEEYNVHNAWLTYGCEVNKIKAVNRKWFNSMQNKHPIAYITCYDHSWDCEKQVPPSAKNATQHCHHNGHGEEVVTTTRVNHCRRGGSWLGIEHHDIGRHLWV